jgi:hypothetical protein
VKQYPDPVQTITTDIVLDAHSIPDACLGLGIVARSVFEPATMTMTMKLFILHTDGRLGSEIASRIIMSSSPDVAQQINAEIGSDLAGNVRNAELAGRRARH